MSQTAFFAIRCFFADSCAVPDDERVIFVEESDIVRQVLHEEVSEFRVVKVALNPSQPREEPVGISVDDKTRFFGGVEDDGIRGFRPDAIDGEQFLAQFWECLFKHHVHGAFCQVFNKCAHLLCFGAIIP